MTITFKDIIAWQKAHEFVLYVYKICSIFPNTENMEYGLSLLEQQFLLLQI